MTTRLPRLRLSLPPPLRGRFGQMLRADPTPSEAYATIPALIWAAVMFWPACTFCVSHSYDAMRILPEWVWGAIFLLMGSAGVRAWLRQGLGPRRRVMFWTCPFWIVVTWFLTHAAPTATGYVYLVPALAAAIAYLQITERLSRDLV